MTLPRGARIGEISEQNGVITYFVPRLGLPPSYDDMS